MRKPLVLSALLVAVAAVPANAGDRPVQRINIRDNYFQPSKKTIVPYTIVRWVWKGDDLHNVVLYSAPSRIDEDDYGKYSSPAKTEGTFKRTLKTRGVYKFECTIHPNMRLRITVKKPD